MELGTSAAGNHLELVLVLLQLAGQGAEEDPPPTGAEGAVPLQTYHGHTILGAGQGWHIRTADKDHALLCISVELLLCRGGYQVWRASVEVETRIADYSRIDFIYGVVVHSDKSVTP